jgi:NAD(P)-dependent dehydrogenase (short-subunit alcohol dehydrogenase family)
MEGKLKGQTAIVTGGGSGIGRATVLRFAHEGANVIAADYNLIGAEETAKLSTVQVGEVETGQVLAFKADISKAADAEAMVNFAVEKFGGLDILVNNAGVGVPGTVVNTSEEDWDRIMNINVKGTFLCSKYAITQFLKQPEDRRGNIVNLSSIAALVAVVDRAAYGTSKGAILSLTKAMAADHVRDGVRVNCICPGTVDTPWVDRMVSTYNDPDEARRKMVARQPVGRLGSPEEMAGAILYLASPEAAFVTGSALIIDGGFTGFKLPN